MSNYLLSVIIPTKDRYEYLKECIESLVKLDSSDMEIVIQDNSTNNAKFLEYLSVVKSKHVKYFYNQNACSQTENYNRAIYNSSGDFIIGLGDDDSITSAAIEVAKLMQKYSIDACNVNMAGYYWPDVFKYDFSKPPLSFDKRAPKLQIVDTKLVLKRYLKTGMQDLKYLPRIYHAILSRQVLIKIKKATGSFCPGASPDMANAVAASFFVEKHLMLRYPVIISGSAFNSAAGKGLRGEHKGDLSNAKQLPSDVEVTWNSKIPKVWLGNTVWPQSALQALSKLGENNLSQKFNFLPMYARIYLKHPEYRELVNNNLHSINDNILLYIWCVREAFSWLYRSVKNSIKRKVGIEYVHKEIISLQEACDITEMHLEHSNIKLSKCFSDILKG